MTVDKQSQPLISRFRIRYAPTLSLATFPGPGRNPAGNTAVVVGKLYPRDDDAVARAAFDAACRGRARRRGAAVAAAGRRRRSTARCSSG